MIKGAIFDIDRTLLDSMPIWENVGARYLATLGIKAKPDLKERLDALSLPEGAIYMQKEYGLSVSAEDILLGRVRYLTWSMNISYFGSRRFYLCFA